VGEAVCHDVEPRFELVVTAAPDLDPGWRDSLGLVLQGKAEHVFKRCEPIASFGQQGADRGVGEVREFDLHGGAAGGEGPLDLVKVGRARHAAEAEPRDLVQWRARFGKARYTAGDRNHEARGVCPATVGGLAALGDELRLDPLDALGQGGAAEEGQSVGVDAQRLEDASRGCALPAGDARGQVRSIPVQATLNVRCGSPGWQGHYQAVTSGKRLRRCAWDCRPSV